MPGEEHNRIKMISKEFKIWIYWHNTEYPFALMAVCLMFQAHPHLLPKGIVGWENIVKRTKTKTIKEIKPFINS